MLKYSIEKFETLYSIQHHIRFENNEGLIILKWKVSLSSDIQVGNIAIFNSKDLFNCSVDEYFQNCSPEIKEFFIFNMDLL